ncbi:MAG: hypothetical protein HOP11_02695 [Saprospiraceae bacterium]|nr:hypothetical protein [Saprospiraceae bacterium]
MMKYYLLSFFLLNIITSNGQNVSKSIGFGNLTKEYALGCIEVDGDLLISAIVRCKLDEDVPSEFCNCMLRIRPNGEVVWKKLMEFSTDYHSQLTGHVNMHRSGDSIIVSGMSRMGEKSYTRINICHINGYLIDQIDLETENFSWHQGMLFKNNTYILLNKIENISDPSLNFQILRLNSEFRKIDSVTIKSKYITNGGNILIDSNNNYIIGAWGGNLIYLTKLNNELQLDWLKIVRTVKSLVFGLTYVSNGPNGNFYCCSPIENEFKQGVNAIEGIGVFLISADGEVKWKLEYNGWYDIECYGIKTLENDDLLVFGTVNTYDIKNISPAWVARISKDGKIIWNKIIIDSRFKHINHIITNVAIDKINSNFLFTGVITDTFPDHYPTEKNPNVWFLTLDKNGCYNGNCADTIIIEDKIVNSIDNSNFLSDDVVEFYPNPIQDHLNVKFKSREKRVLQICDNFGKVVYNIEIREDHINLNLNFLNSGVYNFYFIDAKGEKSERFNVLKK